MISSQIPRFVAIDVECADGLHPWEGARMFSLAAVFDTGMTKFWRDNFGGLEELMADESVDKVFFNAKFDTRHIMNLGYKIKGRVWDVMIFAHLLYGRRQLSLDALQKAYLPNCPPKVVEEIDAWFKANGYKKDEQGKNFHRLPPELLEKRNIGDAVITALLFKKFYPTVAQTFPVLLEQEHRLIPIVRKMEDRGLLVDTQEALRQQAYLDQIMYDVISFGADFIGARDFNTNSYDDQCKLLEKAGLLHLMTNKTPTGKIQLKAENLRELHHPVSSMLLVGKQARQLSSTFIGQMLDFQCADGVLHPGFNQCGTVTGRFSSAKPNLLNMPAEGGHLTEDEYEEQIELTGIDLLPHIKRIFMCRPGYAHLHADKSKLEVCMVGHYTNDRTLITMLNDRKIDIHAEISQRMFQSTDKSLRVRSKAVVFGYIYGAGDLVIARKVKGSISDAREYRKKLELLCPGLPRWKSELNQQIRDRGYIITDHGRRHYLYESEGYMAVNRICQGDGADEVKSRMVALGEFFESEYPDCTVLLNIHDDIGSEVPLELAAEIAPKYKEIMEQTSIPYRVPLPIGKTDDPGEGVSIYTTNWGEAKDIRIVENGQIHLVEKAA